jgi:hypothetical protein
MRKILIAMLICCISESFASDETSYNYYIGGNIAYLLNTGGGSVHVPSVIGTDDYISNPAGQGMAGGMYVGVETAAGYSFEMGALQVGSVTNYSGSYGFGFSNKVNMTVPYFGVGYRIPMAVPTFLDKGYFQWLKKISFKPFVGLGVGIANNMYSPNARMEDYTRTPANQVSTYVLPYFKFDVQYKITNHLNIGADVGYLLKTNYSPMEVDDPKGDIQISNINNYNSLMTGVSIEYSF